MDLNDTHTLGEYTLDPARSLLGPVTGSCEHGYEPSGSVNIQGFFDYVVSC
jgi:hypothetical protein